MTKILIVDDEESICWGLSKLCSEIGAENDIASNAERGLELAAKCHYDVVVMDVRLPGMDGLTAIKHFREILGSSPIIIITAFGDLQTAIDAIQQGAFEYIVKPFDLGSVRKTIQHAIAATQLSFAEGDRETSDGISELGIVGSSALMQEVFKQIALTTTSDAPVLITGESGTGKELTARSIHNFSQRSSKPFVPVNIAALNPNLAESELFGHAKGAFTGAEANREGLIQQANGGTLFLDEVAEIPLAIQVKLLRVLDHCEVIPVGSNTPVKTDFRLISATNQDLLSQINHGDFRHDLFYRLRTFEIRLPPLRERKEDIPELVDHFLRHTRGGSNVSTTAEFVDSLKTRPWYGNIRELQSVVERASTLAMGGLLTPEHIEQVEQSPALEPADSALVDQIQTLIAEWTRKHWDDVSTDSLYDALLSVIDPAVLLTSFELSDHQYSAAARRLGIHRTTLKKKLDELGELQN